jgi:hypothetical protein
VLLVARILVELFPDDVDDDAILLLLAALMIYMLTDYRTKDVTQVFQLLSLPLSLSLSLDGEFVCVCCLLGSCSV